MRRLHNRVYLMVRDEFAHLDAVVVEHMDMDRFPGQAFVEHSVNMKKPVIFVAMNYR